MSSSTRHETCLEASCCTLALLAGLTFTIGVAMISMGCDPLVNPHCLPDQYSLVHGTPVQTYTRPVLRKTCCFESPNSGKCALNSIVPATRSVVELDIGGGTLCNMSAALVAATAPIPLVRNGAGECRPAPSAFDRRIAWAGLCLLVVFGVCVLGIFFVDAGGRWLDEYHVDSSRALPSAPWRVMVLVCLALFVAGLATYFTGCDDTLTPWCREKRPATAVADTVFSITSGVMKVVPSCGDLSPRAGTLQWTTVPDPTTTTFTVQFRIEDGDGSRRACNMSVASAEDFYQFQGKTVRVWEYGAGTCAVEPSRHETYLARAGVAMLAVCGLVLVLWTAWEAKVCRSRRAARRQQQPQPAAGHSTLPVPLP